MECSQSFSPNDAIVIHYPNVVIAKFNSTAHTIIETASPAEVLPGIFIDKLRLFSILSNSFFGAIGAGIVHYQYVAMASFLIQDMVYAVAKDFFSVICMMWHYQTFLGHL